MKTEYYDLRDPVEREAGIAAGSRALISKETVAFPTETVYGLGALARDAAAVERVFTVKGRPLNNPVLVHVSDMEMARETGRFSELGLELAKLWPGPLSLVVPAASWVPDRVTAGLSTVGIRMPSHEGALDLIAVSGPIAAPSANRSGRPSPTRLEHVREDLDGKVPVILDGGPCQLGLESTVIDVTGRVPVILRPGAVTREEVAALVGDCQVAQGVLEQVEGTAARSPGMLHTHYAPRGEAVLIRGGHGLDRARALRAEAEAAGRLTVIVGPNLPREQGMIPCDIMGEHGLFYALRAADEMGAQFVIIMGTGTAGEGLAYMNRAIRAAGYRVLEESR